MIWTRFVAISLCWLVIGFSLQLSSSLFGSQAIAHDRMLKQCHRYVPTDTVVLIGAAILGNGLVAEYYDRNADGKADVISYSFKTKKGHQPFPVYYEVDLDYDTFPDKRYIDVRGNGRCENIFELEDYNSPGDHQNLEGEAIIRI